MELKDIAMLVFGAFSSAALIISGITAARGQKSKSLLDGSQAAENFQESLVILQERMATLESVLFEYMRGTRILIAQLQRRNIVPDWLPPNETPTQPPRRNTGSLGMRK